MKIKSSTGEIVEVPLEYQDVVRQNINNPEYINMLIQSFTGRKQQYGGNNDHLSVYPMAMNNGGVSDSNFPNQDNNYTTKRLSAFIDMVKGSAEKAIAKEMEKEVLASLMTPPGQMMKTGGSTPYQNGLTAGTGWLARHGGNHNIPQAQWGMPYEQSIPLNQYPYARSSWIPPLNFGPMTYSTDQQITPGTQVTGADVKGNGRSFTLDVNVPQDNLNLANQITVDPVSGQGDWATSSFNGPYDSAGNQVNLPSYSDQTPPAMDPVQNTRLAVAPPTPGAYKADKLKFKRNPRLNNQQKVMLANTAMEFATNIDNRVEEAQRQEQLRKRMTADSLFDPIQGNRGDYTANYGYPRPDQMVQVQFPGAAGSMNYGQYGGSQNDEVYMTEDEIQEILANGGEIQYLD